MHFALPVITALALSIPTTSAWKVWVNWNPNCGGDSYFTQGALGRACLNVIPHGDGSLPQSFTYFTNGESGCVASIFTGANCAANTLIGSTNLDNACLSGRFESYSINCF